MAIQSISTPIHAFTVNDTQVQQLLAEVKANLNRTDKAKLNTLASIAFAGVSDKFLHF